MQTRQWYQCLHHPGSVVTLHPHEPGYFITNQRETTAARVPLTTTVCGGLCKGLPVTGEVVVGRNNIRHSSFESVTSAQRETVLICEEAISNSFLKSIKMMRVQTCEVKEGFFCI